MHVSAGGPERCWAAWSGGGGRVAVAVLCHGDGCRWAFRVLPFLVMRVAAVLGGAVLRQLVAFELLESGLGRVYG